MGSRSANGGAPSLIPAREGIVVPGARHLRNWSLSWVPLAVFLAVSGATLPATTACAAAQTFVALEYQVEPGLNGCPEAPEFRSTVERQLGYDPFRSIADRRVAVMIERKGASIAGRIRWSDDRGRWVGDRHLTSRRPDCTDMAASLAFSVAVQIQLIATLAPSTAEPPPAVEAPVAPPEPAADAPAQEPIAPPPPSRAAPPRLPEPPRVEQPRPLKLSLGIGPSLALSLAPRPTGLGRIFVDGRVSSISLELALDAALPATQREADGSGFSLQRFAAGAAACGHVRDFAACLTTTVGLLRARGLAVDAPASSAGLFSQLGARVGAARELGRRYFVAARAEALVMLSSWNVRLNETAVWTTPRLGLVAGFDLGVRFF